ncbi:MAG: hypothetical protein AMXMBFR82_11630 [Candidatus Hydrogenedentota bacterium]
MSMTIRELVGEDREKYSVNLDRTIRQVIDYMYDGEVRAVAVCDGDKVVGVFSERDLLRRIVRQGLDLNSTKVRDAMTSPAYWISMDERYEVAKAIMVDKRLGQLVVKDEHHQFRGFVSWRELLEADLSDSRDLVGKLNDDYYEHRFQP